MSSNPISNRYLLNLITIPENAEDRNDPHTEQKARMLREGLETSECPFLWFNEGQQFHGSIYTRAVNRNHLYSWEGTLRPFVMKILQAYMAMCRGDRLVVVKSLTLAEKIVRRGEKRRQYKILHYCMAITHVFASTMANVLYRCGLYTKGLEMLETVVPMISLDRHSMAGIYFMRAYMMFQAGRPEYFGGLKWTAYGLQRDPQDPELRFLWLQFAYGLWREQLDKKFMDLITAHLNHDMMEDNLAWVSFQHYFNSTSWMRDSVEAATYKMERALLNTGPDTSTADMEKVEMIIIRGLESDPTCHGLISFTSQFFLSTYQPEKSHFLDGFLKEFRIGNAERWLDCKMLLYPESCDRDVYQGLLQYHQGFNAAKLYKRMSYHYVMVDPERAYLYANNALHIESSIWAREDVNDDVPIYDEKIAVFGSKTRLGFYRFMVYYAHYLAQGNQAEIFLRRIRPMLPTYMDALQPSEEVQNILDLLLKNEYYRHPMRIPLHGCYPPCVLHYLNE